MRPLYISCYLEHPTYRLMPLMVGGFWTNVGTALYCCVVGFAGVQDFGALWWICLVGVQIGIIVVGAGLKPAKQSKGKK